MTNSAKHDTSVAARRMPMAVGSAEPYHFSKGDVSAVHKAAVAWSKAHPNPFSYHRKRKTT